MRDGPGNRLAEAIEVEPEWTPSLESVAAEAAAPTLATPSLTLDRDMSLAGGSSVFKDGVVFLWDDTTGNTALGRDALSTNTAGTRNTVVGDGALSANTTGSGNTAMGREALFSNTTADGNTAFGSYALFSNTEGSGNTAVGREALMMNSESEPGYHHFFASENTAVGDQALRSNISGVENTAIGRRALHSNTTGFGNTASGAFALRSNTTGRRNTASGGNTLFRNTTGNWNTASGWGALYDNTTGSSNTATGMLALAYNTTGYSNTASGGHALLRNTTGNFNTACGRWALLSNTSGAYNTAVGRGALYSNTTGFENTAMGASALYYKTTGSRNVAVGYRAGSLLGYKTSASGLDDNIFIANLGESEDADTIRIGTQGTQSKTFIAGIRGTTTDVADAIPVLIDSNGQLGTVSSSRRFKEDIRDMAEASDRLLALRPVTFRYRQHAGSDESRLQYGLIAEEVAEVFPELVVSSEDGEPETVLYHLMTAMLVNELQKQHERAEAQEGRLADQRRELERLRARLAGLEGELVRSGPQKTRGQPVSPRPPDTTRR